MAVAATPVEDRPTEGFIMRVENKTLREIRDQMEDEGGESIRRSVSNVRIHLTDTDTACVEIKPEGQKRKTIELPADDEGLVAFGDYFGIPSAYLKRCEPALREMTLNYWLETKTGSDVVLRYTDNGVKEVHDPDKQRIDTRRLVDRLLPIVTPDAKVLSKSRDKEKVFRIDVISPEGHERGWGGDRKVGDLTGGGIRVEQNRGKQNLAPSISKLLYRLVCTNGMEVLDPALKMDARGVSVDEVLDEFERLAEQAFSAVEADIKSFYELRHQRVEKPEQAILRYAQEHKIPATISNEVVRAVATIEGDDDFSMFDLVNLFTNQANDPAIQTYGSRQALQRLGGNVIHEHRRRCSHCHGDLDAAAAAAERVLAEQ